MGLRTGVFVAVIAAYLLSGCGGQDSAITAASPELSRAGLPDSPEHSVSAVTGHKAAPSLDDTEVITELITFTSPSGNVGCYLDATDVRCDISERDWAPPRRPADCEFGYGQGITMSPGGDAEFVCAGDTALGGGDPLPYGQSISAGVLRCDSAESGITCRDTESGRGFALSRERYEIF